nr:DNA alkylation repair protein [uncultured Celeribacter sp.]
MAIEATEAMTILRAKADAKRAEQLQVRTGQDDCLGVAPGDLETLARAWRQDTPFPDRLTLAQALWHMGTLEGRIMAAKLLTQARIKDDAAVWAQITQWLDSATGWAEVDALASAGSRRLMADLSRMEEVEARAMSEGPLARRAALGLTESLAKLPHPSPEEAAALDRACDWLPAFLEDGDKDVHRAAQSWLRALSKHHFKRTKMIRTARN